MTRKKWRELKYFEREKILAVYQGYTEIEVEPDRNYRVTGISGKLHMREPIPEYENDLDEMNYMEELLTPEEAVIYEKWLEKLCQRTEIGWHIWHASAEERAFAFILTKDVEPDQ